MGKYRVISYFTDLQDGEHVYKVGDAYPRAGMDAAEERVKELAGNENLQGRALIEAIDDEEKSKSNGAAKVQPEDKKEKQVAEKKDK